MRRSIAQAFTRLVVKPLQRFIDSIAPRQGGIDAGVQASASERVLGKLLAIVKSDHQALVRVRVKRLLDGLTRRGGLPVGQPA